MKKLLKLKSWYTIDQAAARLCSTLAENVSTADVIQFAAEGLLDVCWFLSGEYFARPVEVYCTYPRTDIPVMSRPRYDDQGQSVGECVAGIYRMPLDLCPSWGWWLLTFIGQGGESQDFCGPLIVDADGALWELFEPGGNDFAAFPTIEAVVFTREAIEAFEHAATNEPPISATGLNAREKQSYLAIIGALCRANNLDASHPYKAAEIIKNLIEQDGGSISVENIAAKLRQL